MTNNQTTLVSREASIRTQQKQEARHQQGVDMRAKWAENQSLIRNPVDMAQALADVRTSSVSIPQTLARYQGTTLYNPIPPKR